MEINPLSDTFQHFSSQLLCIVDVKYKGIAIIFYFQNGNTWHIYSYSIFQTSVQFSVLYKLKLQPKLAIYHEKSAKV